MFKMKGIVPPMITPFAADGEVDTENLVRLLDFLKTRVDGLFICGSYGSGPMMSLSERKLVAEITHATVGKDIPVIVHIGTTNTRDSIELGLHALSLGCDAVAAVGPYYYHHNQENVMEYYSKILIALERQIPFYIYHNVKFSGYEINIDTLKKLKGLGIHGIKDATFDLLKLATYMRELADETFDVALGTEALWTAACALGCRSFIPGLGNAFPEICRKMYLEGIEGKQEECRQTQFKVNRIREIMYLAKSTQLAVYAMLEIRGVIKAYPRSPFVPAEKEEIDSIRKELQALGMV